MNQREKKMNLLKKLYRKYILKRNFTDSQVQEMRSEIKKLANELEGNNTKSIIINQRKAMHIEITKFDLLNEILSGSDVRAEVPGTGKTMDELRREGTYE